MTPPDTAADQQHVVLADSCFTDGHAEHEAGTH